MGLDVHAVTKYEVIENATDEQIEDHYSIWQPDDFIEHLGENLKSGMIVDKKETDGHYRSGYGRHGYFRDFLASLVYPCVQIEKPSYSDSNYSDKEYQHRFPYVHGMYQKEDLKLEDDFVAIIHFSDCEGVIGNELCLALDKAFDKHMEKAVESDWSKAYKDMAECVKAAANSGGYLDFH